MIDVHKMMTKKKYYDDITDIIQSHVDMVAEEYWGDDECKPTFLVSISEEVKKS
jgi:hypothetical protein